MSDTEPRVSSNWNGIVYTAHASNAAGTKFGTGTGSSEEEARSAALKDLEKAPDKTAPEQGGGHSTADPEAEREAAKAAGRTGDRGK